MSKIPCAPTFRIDPKQPNSRFLDRYERRKLGKNRTFVEVLNGQSSFCSPEFKGIVPFYVKLQDAFVAEKGDFTGTWQQIGYQMFSNSNFEYGEGTAASCEAGSDGCKGYPEVAARTTESAFAETNAWYAKNKTALNDCATGSTPWTITTSANGTTGGSVLYNAAVSSTDCENLTPSFTKLKTTASN